MHDCYGSLPSATYRLQLDATFTLFDAAEVVSYLAALGIDVCYCSPILAAASGSSHGYDVVDHSRIDESRGGEAGLVALGAALSEHTMGLVVDVVSNHMSIAEPTANWRWAEVLRNGEGAATASWFDIDWSVRNGRVLLPVLAADFEPSRDLLVDTETLSYRGLRLPLAPSTRSLAQSLDNVLAAQHYELVDGRGPIVEVNYRRFFAVSELAGIRVEEPEVFEATHATLQRMLASDLPISGIRVDHPDGLADPREYLERLRSLAPSKWITVEKILATGETLPESWPVAGTTGYDALSDVSTVFLDPATLPAVDRTYRALTGDERGWPEHAAAGKRHVANTILRPEVLRIARLASDTPEVIEAITELAVAFDVYRSYAPFGEAHLSRAAATVEAARSRLAPTMAGLRPRLRDPNDEMCVRFQQLTAAVMAKGVEDTAYYRYSRFLALNEVGGDPDRFGCDVEDFHRRQRHRLLHASQSMTTLSTHDTKRGEDVRARLFVLAELIEAWRAVAEQLLELAPVPDRSFGYLLGQTIVGAWPIERDRLHAFAEKAMREASDGTNWHEPDAAFEATVHAAVDATYDDPDVSRVVGDFTRQLEPYGWSNALSQKLVQLTMPGIPDLYQGSETGEFSLVDPDNRRPVDFAARARRLKQIDARPGEVPADWPGRKLVLCAHALRARRDRSELFTDYVPVVPVGSAAKHLIAFDRGGAVTLATRLPVGLERCGGWGSTAIELPPGAYRDPISGRLIKGSVAVGDVLADLPAALLLRVA